MSTMAVGMIALEAVAPSLLCMTSGVGPAQGEWVIGGWLVEPCLFRRVCTNDGRGSEGTPLRGQGLTEHFTHVMCANALRLRVGFCIWGWYTTPQSVPHHVTSLRSDTDRGGREGLFACVVLPCLTGAIV